MMANTSVLSTDASGNLLPNANDPSISADGTLVAFDASAPGVLDYSGPHAIYVKNLLTGDSTLVSTASDGTRTGNAFGSSISADSGSVVFSAYVPLSGSYQVYEKNLSTGDLTLVSQTADGTALISDESGPPPAVSVHGRFVAFDSLNLGPPTDTEHVGLKDMRTGKLRVVSTNAAGELENGASTLDSMSAGGRLVAFTSSSSNLVADPSNGDKEIYVKNMWTGGVTLVSQTADGVSANGSSDQGSLSADGTKIAFSSYADNLLPGVSGQGGQIYVKNLVTGDLSLVSSAADGTPANGYTEYPIISPDGRYAMFRSNATNLVPGGTAGPDQVYVKDLGNGAITRLSQDASGAPGTSLSYTSFPSEHAFSYDGSQAVFTSLAPNLTGDTGGNYAVIGATQSVTTVQENHAPDGTLTGYTYLHSDGSVLYNSDYSVLPNGNVQYAYSGGTFFDNKHYSSFADTYSPSGDLLTHSQANNNGSHTIEGGGGDGLILHSIGNDTLTGGGTNERFVFTPGFGHDTITDFIPGGPGHDNLGLSRSDFGSIAAVLQDTTQHGANTVIADPLSGDHLTLVGVSQSDLVAHKRDIHLFG